MIHSTRNLMVTLVVSLFVAVISLPGITFAATAAPKFTPLTQVKAGMIAPVRIQLDSSGNYYVADSRNKGVLKYNAYGRLIKVFPTTNVPLGVALQSDGHIVVTQGTYVSILDENGTEVRRVGQFGKANDVAVDMNDYIFVTDSMLCNVSVFTGAGDPVFVFGSKGVATVNKPKYGQFNNPSAIEYEKASNQIAVVDTLNGRIQFFDASTYAFVKSVGTPGDDVLKFVSPQGVTFEYDAEGSLKRMYVVDTWKNDVRVIDPVTGGTFTFLASIGCGGVNGAFRGSLCGGLANGQFELPSDVTFDQVNKRLFVVNGVGHLQIFGIDGGASPFDGNPPTLKIDAVPNHTNSPSLAITGTIEAGAEFAITTDTAATAVGTNVNVTSWSTTITGLTVGTNNITFVAMDAAGNQTTKTVAVVYAQTAPSLTITTPNNEFVKAATKTIAGTVAAGATVSVTNTTTGVAGQAVVTDGTWTYNAPQLLEGVNNFTVTATMMDTSVPPKALSDVASANVSVIRDQTAPVVSVSALADGAYSSTLTQNVYGFVSDVHPGSVTVTVNSVPTVITDTVFSVQVPLQVGPNVITVQATDLAGNTSFLNSRTINYDGAAPVVEILAPSPADNSYVNTSSVALNGRVTPATSTIKVNGTSVPVDGSGNWSVTSVNLTNGLNTIQVVGTSGVKSAGVKRSIFYDAGLPVLSIASPAQDMTTNQPNLEITGTVSDTGSAVTVSATINGVLVSPAPTVSNGTFSFNTGAMFVQGVNAIVVTATDAAGNASVTSPSTTRNITFDSVHPFLSLTTPTSSYPSQIGGSVEPSATVTITDGTYSVQAAVTPGSPNSTWSAAIDRKLYNPATIQITAADAAGNNTVITSLTPPVAVTGDINGIGGVDVVDAQLALQSALGARVPTPDEILRADIGPLYNGKQNPDGKIGIEDAILILRKALGAPVSW